ncbi:WD40/YVTN/BNR-like repeat-containing protein [candidate division KSB1 bacterium]
MMILFAKRLVQGVILFSLIIMISYSTLSAQALSDKEIEYFRWRNIGPANFQGRISDIEALDDDFSKVLIAGASGGVWKSDNAGTTWEPIFDNYGSASIGDIARSNKNPDIIWVGTGEANNRNSVAWGDGVYKSEDGGKTFQHMGLSDTYQIARIVIHPDKPDIVYAAAAGNLWAYNGSRGIFKTSDGGKTWEKLTNGLPDDGMTGASDIVVDPNKPNTLYAAMYQRLRRPWRFDSGGPNGGIYKSTNAGKSWKKLTKGLPNDATGRIGLSIYKKNPKIIMAWVENKRVTGRNSRDMNIPGSGIYRSENGGKSWELLNRLTDRPFYYSQIRIDPNDDRKVYAIATEYRYSEDGGRNFKMISGYGRGDTPKLDLHVDYHAMWIDPNNSDRFYIGNDGGASVTFDGGKTFRFFDNINVAQFYAIGVDMRDPYYVYGGLQDNGSWAGISNSRNSYGILTDHWFKFGGGDGFFAQIDPNDWRTVYGESQGGNIFRFDPVTRTSARIAPNNPRNDPDNRRATLYRFNWSAPILISPHNSRTVYFGGNVLFRSVDRGDNWEVVSPDLTTNDPDKKEQWDTGGLTSDYTGAEAHCTIITIAESPVTPGLIWVGTDDGNIQLSRNGGGDWENVRHNLSGVPDHTWVSRVEASHFDEGTAYVTFDNHRNGDFSTWVYKTADFGRTWENITNNLPEGNSAYVIREDHINKNLLFAGTEFGLFMSRNGGRTWQKFMNNFPTVAVHDIVIHPRDNDLIAGTHGRGIFILDDITPLQQLNDDSMTRPQFLLESGTATRWLTVNKDQGEGWVGSDFYRGENPETVAKVVFYIKEEPSDIPKLEICDITGMLSKKVELTEAHAGINIYKWDMNFDPFEFTTEEQELYNRIGNLRGDFEQTMAIGEQLQNMLKKRGLDVELFSLLGFGRRGGGQRTGPPAQPGEYLVKLKVNGELLKGILKIRQDPLMEK